MIAQQLQNLKSFVFTQLSDVVDWGKHVQVDNNKTTSDHAYILIVTPFNRYRMSAAGAYIDPPMGAPVECRSLGTITCDDLADGKRIIGGRLDKTFDEISRHVHKRELADAIAAARRDMAEADKAAADTARTKLADLAGRAKKWGIDVNVPPAVEHSEPMPATRQAVVEPIPEPDDGSPKPFPGAPVVFVTNPGEQIGGMNEIPGHCVKVMPGNRISMFVTPDHSEPSYRDNLPKRGPVHRFNCWDWNPHFLLDQQIISGLSEEFEKLREFGKRNAADIYVFGEQITSLAARLDAIERAQVPAAAIPRSTETLSLKKKP